jgi:hypothetical protein
LTARRESLKCTSLYAGIAQLVERNLAKVEVASSRLVSRSSIKKTGKAHAFPVLVSSLKWRDSKAVMPRPAKPFRPVRLRLAPPSFLPFHFLFGMAYILPLHYYIKISCLLELEAGTVLEIG